VNPNPNLKPEEAYHFEAGYKGNIRFTGSRVFQPSLDITAAAYYSSLQNMLAEKTNSTGQIERINANKTAYYGFETGISAVLNSFLSMGGDFALNKYKVEYSEEGTTAAGNYPSSTFSVYFIVNPFVRFSAKTLSTLSLIPSVEYEGSRYGSKRMVNVNAANKLPAYALFNCRVSSDITDFFTAAAGIENILDANYALENGALPLAGRTFYFTLTAKY
jgi:iron complex outermembrane receptor protein